MTSQKRPPDPALAAAIAAEQTFAHAMLSPSERAALWRLAPETAAVMRPLTDDRARLRRELAARMERR